MIDLATPEELKAVKHNAATAFKNMIKFFADRKWDTNDMTSALAFVMATKAAVDLVEPGYWDQMLENVVSDGADQMNWMLNPPFPKTITP